MQSLEKLETKGEVRKLVLVLSDADPIELPVAGTDEDEEEFFYALSIEQRNECMDDRFQSALFKLLHNRIYLRPSKIISAFCFTEEFE